MTIRYLSTHYAVAPQITPSEVGRLKKHGMRALHLPVTPGRIAQADLNAFAACYASAPKPVLGFCRTGMRAEALWEGTRLR